MLNSLQYIQDFDVNLICVEDGIDSSKDSGKLTITVLSAVAEIERKYSCSDDGRTQAEGKRGQVERWFCSLWVSVARWEIDYQ